MERRPSQFAQLRDMYEEQKIREKHPDAVRVRSMQADGPMRIDKARKLRDKIMANGANQMGNDGKEI